MTHRGSNRLLQRLALGLTLLAFTPLAFAQHPGGGGGGSPRGMSSGGQMGGGQPGGGQPAGGQMGGDHGASPALTGQNPVGNAGGFRGEGMQQPSIRSAPAVGIPGRFWNDSSTARTLKLRPEQQHRMDAIFDANRPTLQTLFTNLQREEAKLSAISPKSTQDQTKVFAAIDRVAQARADLEREKKQLVLALRKEMDPQQVQQLDQISSAH